jgi:hypothetical protein
MPAGAAPVARALGLIRPPCYGYPAVTRATDQFPTPGFRFAVEPCALHGGPMKEFTLKQIRGHIVVLPFLGMFCTAVLAGGTGSGPDVIVSTIGSTLSHNGTLDTDPGPAVANVSAYSMTTVSCNLGEQDAIWIDCTSGTNCNQHPVIGQNLYRLMDGRFEMIGQAWLKHGFCAADAPSCGTPYESNPSCDWLGTHATDTYSASLNGQQSNMGPKSEINAWSGVYPYPYILAWSQSGNAIYKRMQVRTDDLAPAGNPGALYFGESQYICTDERESNRYNNVSYRKVLVGAPSGSGWNLSFTGSTFQQQPAIEAWVANDTGVTLADVDVASDGRFIVGYKVTDLGNGRWHYEYAVYNMNSHRSARALGVTIPAGVTVENIGFRDVFYHSGEPYSGADWTAVPGAGKLEWSTDDFATNPNANAIRWGTLYNFRFDADTAPAVGPIDLTLFRPGIGDTVTFNGAVPSAPPGPCDGIDHGDADCDGAVNFLDIDPFLVALFDMPAYIANPDWCGNDCAADINDDGAVDNFDIDGFLDCLFGGC